MAEDRNCLSVIINSSSMDNHRIYLARRTILEVLLDGGYAISRSDINQTLADFISSFGKNPELD